MSMTPLYQLSALLAQNALKNAPPGSAQAQGAEATLQSAQAAIQAEAMRQIKKRKEKEEKRKKWGGIGSKVGSVLGVAAAPFTGGTSLAATAGLGALGAASGGAVGELASGGGIRPGNLLPYALEGGVSGAMTWAAPKINSYLANQTTRGTSNVMGAAEPRTSVNPRIVASNQRELATGMNPFQARLQGVTQPATPMGAAPMTPQVNQATRVSARQNPGQTIMSQVANYAQGQAYMRPFQAGMYRYDPRVPSAINYQRDPRTGQLVEY